MKWLLFQMGIMSWLIVSAQTVIVNECIGITTAKTISLIFPSHVRSIDRGSDLILVQKSQDHIVKVKAIKDSFPETNLTIITAEGKLYSFLLRYEKSPDQLVWHFGEPLSIQAVHPFQAAINQIKKDKSRIQGIQYHTGKVSIQWMGWFIQGNNLFCKLKLTNRSSIGFDMDQVQCYIRDNHISKRTASQELLQQPRFISGDTSTLKARSSFIWVIALEKFTIPDDKHFAIEIFEKNGGRHLYLKLYNRELMHAKEL